MKPISQTLLDKLWAAHEVLRRNDGVSLLWIDRHLVHEGRIMLLPNSKSGGYLFASPI